MKRIICIICAGVILALTGCGSDNSGANKDAKNVNDLFSSSAKDTSTSEATNSSDEKLTSDTQTSAAVSEEKTTSKSEGETQTDVSSESTSAGSDTQAYDKIDTDLSAMSDTMAYAELVNMVNEPDKYNGKVVKIKGVFAVASENGNNYFACMLTDATACCSQPLEFVLSDKSLKYPADYPSVDSLITVVGKFGTYNEGANVYYRLSEAQLM